MCGKNGDFECKTFPLNSVKMVKDTFLKKVSNIFPNK